MEEKLAEFRKRKKEQNPISSQKATIIKSDRPSPLFNLFNRWQKRLTSSRIFVAISVRLSELPVLRWTSFLYFLLW